MEFLGTDAIAAHVRCTVLGSLPGIKPGDGEVEGETYECPQHVVAFLDNFEGHPDMYERRAVTTLSGHEAYAYYPQSRIIDEEE